jgi:AcrR family transcriptional regulator
MAKATKSKKVKPAIESSAEERIKEAARKLFTQKGFAATRTRDIAEEAGINLALLNYYFRSKQKLFDLVMMENFQEFIKGITINFTDETMTFDQRIERIVVAYVDMLIRLPDLPMFILNEIKGNPSKIAAKLQGELAPMRQNFFKQLIASNKEGKTNLEPFHFVANLVGLTVFPFIARPILQRVTGVTEEQFEQYMQDRKELVPIWIKAMLTPPVAQPSIPPVAPE